MKSKVGKNFLYNVAYQILIVLMPLITSPYVSRVLGASNLGVYTYTYSVADYFILFAMLGIKNYGNRQIAKVRDNRAQTSATFINMYSLQLIISVIMVILYYGYVFLLVKENRLIAIIQGIYVMTAVADISWFFFGMEEFKITVTRNTVIKLCSVTAIFIFVKTPDDLWKYTLILSAGMMIGYFSIFPFLKKYIDFMRPSLAGIKLHIKPNLLLFIPVIAVSIFNVMDKIMLGELSSMAEVGYYGNTEKLMRIPLGIITALGTVMMPYMSHMVSSGDIERSKKTIERSMVFIMCLGCGLAGGLAGVGKVFAPIFFGDEFVKCGMLVIFISPTVLSLSWANVIRMQYLIPNGMDREFTVSTIIGAVVNLVINILLIPKMGALGAIIGTVCAEASLTIYQTYVVRMFLPIKRYLLECMYFLIFGILMSAVVNVIGENLGSHVYTLIMQLFVGVVLYLLPCVFYLFLSKNCVILDFKNMLLSEIKRFRIRLSKKINRY